MIRPLVDDFEVMVTEKSIVSSAKKIEVDQAQTLEALLIRYERTLRKVHLRQRAVFYYASNFQKDLEVFRIFHFASS